jgi:hypothetical protein
MRRRRYEDDPIKRLLMTAGDDNEDIEDDDILEEDEEEQDPDEQDPDEDEVEDSDDEKPPAVTDPVKLERYIARGLEDVKKEIEDISFDNNECISFDGDKYVDTCALLEDGRCKVHLVRNVVISCDNIDSIITELKSIVIGDKYGDYLSFDVIQKKDEPEPVEDDIKEKVEGKKKDKDDEEPKEKAPEGKSIMLKYIITLPTELMKSIADGNPNKKWKEATRGAESFCKKLLKKL